MSDAYSESLSIALERIVMPAVAASVQAGWVAPPAVELARRMLAVVPVPAPANKMAEQVGPEFYNSAGVAVVLAPTGQDPVSRQAVAARRRRRTVLALPTSDRRYIYPTWQFIDHDVMPGLPEVLAVFQDRPAWSVATWLTTPRQDLEGSTAVEWLRQGKDRDHLLGVAGHTAARWAA